MLKFNHGVEIGAYLAYKGHYMAVIDPEVLTIMFDEMEHRKALKEYLEELGEKPSPVIDFIFKAIGTTVQLMCRFFPEWLLDKVACLLEIFAVFSYKHLATVYKDREAMFLEMAKTEQEHKEYFEKE